MNPTGKVVIPDNTVCIVYRVGDVVKGGAIALNSPDFDIEIRMQIAELYENLGR